MKKYVGVIYVFTILVFAFLLNVGTKGIDLKGMNFTYSLIIYFLITRIILKSFLSIKLKRKETKTILCFIPFVQELILFEESNLKVVFILTEVLFAVFVALMAFSMSTLGVVSLGIDVLDSISGYSALFAIICLLVNRIVSGIRINKLTLDRYMSYGDGMVYGGLSSFSKVISSILVLFPFTRNIAYCFILSLLKG